MKEPRVTNKEIIPIRTESDVERAWAGLSEMQINDPMQTTTAEDELPIYGSDGDIMMTRAEKKDKRLDR